MRINILSSSEQCMLLEVIHSMTKCKDLSHFKEIVSSLDNLLGYDNLILGTPGVTNNNTPSVVDVNVNYPQEWVELYQANEFWRIDPTVKAALETTAPQQWGEIYQKYEPDKQFLSLSRDYGLKDGYSCLVKSRSGQQWTIVAMAGNNFAQKTNKLDCIIDVIAPHLHNALVSVLPDKKTEAITKLSAREIEVLRWLYQGKTSWEASVILNVSESTINFHVRNITTKLNVVNRVQAVAAAVHCGLINII